MSADFQFPTLDLGDLGASLDDAIREDPDIAADEAPAADAATAEEGVSAAAEAPAADAAAGEAAETKPEPEAEADPELDYATRFEADYAERSKADIARLRSSLDRQITKLAKESKAATEDLEETGHYVAFLEAQLEQYDPDEVARFRRNRQGFLGNRVQERQRAEADFQRRAAFRDSEFRRLYPELDPDEPELLEAFRSGDHRLEAALIRERQLKLQLRRPAPATPRPAQAAPAPAPAPPAATAPRDAQGRFVGAAERTREVERQRGAETVARPSGGTARAKPATTLEEGRRALAEGFARMGLPK